MFNAFSQKLVGNTVNMSTVFYDPNGVVYIPDTVTISYKNPNGLLITTPVSLLNSKYTHSVLLDLPGIWYFRWECTGSNASAEEFQITVKDTLVK